MKNARELFFHVFPKRERTGLRSIVATGIAPAGLHRERVQTLPRSNPNFKGNDPDAYMPTDKSLNEVLLENA